MSSSVTITKVRETPATNSTVYDAVFSSGHRAATMTLNTLVLDTRYTVIKHAIADSSSPLIQIIKHNRGTQLAPFRFTTVMAKGKKDACLIMRQYEYERKRLRVTYLIVRKDGGHKIEIDDEERRKLDSIAGYTQANREQDSALAMDVGAFFLEWVTLDAAEQRLKDRDEWVFV